MKGWEQIFDSSVMAEAYIRKARLEAAGIPAVVVEKKDGVYAMLLPQRYELWVQLNEAPSALILLDSEK
jgi:hypothetical protein